MPNFSGGKFTDSHTSIIEAAKKPVGAIVKLGSVKKISLGMIKPIRNGSLSIKFLDEGPGCLLAKVRGPRSIQEIRIYTTDKEEVTWLMQEAIR